MKVTVNDSISRIEPDAWNALTAGNPFLRHEFLLAAETSGSACDASGWRPRHLTCREDGRLRGAMVLYEKSHSWGEFVFDWSWARAYEQAGIPYYPKLVSAVPFSPAAGQRMLLGEQPDREAGKALIDAALELAAQSDCSSLHVLFPPEAQAAELEACGFSIRKDCQFHWHNRGYGDFDGFLAALSSSKRKKTRRDRRRVADAGITFRRLRGGELNEAIWNVVYSLISVTFMRRGNLPYFNLEFFMEIGRTMPENILAILAEQGNTVVAAALFIESADVLYGRYWGSDGYFDALHFETCYYQGIEYCIESGKRLFEPGTQGEHKVSRGFLPAPTWSAHWLKHPEFFRAIDAYVDAERRHIDDYMESVSEHSPYRHE